MRLTTNADPAFKGMGTLAIVLAGIVISTKTSTPLAIEMAGSAFGQVNALITDLRRRNPNWQGSRVMIG